MRPEQRERGPLSQAPVTEETTPNGTTILRDERGRRLCSKTRSDGEQCRGPAIRGGFVCKVHGGVLPSVKASARARLAQLIDPAIDVLAQDLDAKDAIDRQRAANSILDRAGVPRSKDITITDAKEALLEKLLVIIDNNADTRDEDEDDDGGE